MGRAKMQFLRKKLETFRHHHADDDLDAPDIQPPKQPSKKKKSRPPPADSGGGSLIRSNNGYNGDLSRPIPKQSNICGVTIAATGKPLFAGQQEQEEPFSTWPDDEFNDGPASYIDPTMQDEYDSPDEPDNQQHRHQQQHNIGQTGFFGNDNGSSGGTGGSDEQLTSLPPPPPLIHQQQTALSPRNSSGGLLIGGGKLIQRAVSSAASTTPSYIKAALPNRSAASSGASSNNVSRHESVNRRASGGMTTMNSTSVVTTATIIEQSSQASPVSSSTTTSEEQQQPARITHLPQRPQPKVLGSRISEGLDPNKVLTGIQAMVKMNQPGAKVPPTPPKPASFNTMPLLNEVRQTRFVHPPPTVTPPDSDECEPELPSRIKSLMVNSTSADPSSSPSPPSSEASSGPVQMTTKKRQAPLPPPSKLQSTVKPPPPNDAPLPPPVPDFKVAAESPVNSGNNTNNSNPTPSVTSSNGDSNEDLLPPIMTPSTLINKDPTTAFKQRLSLQYTTSSPITVTSSSPPSTNVNSTTFAQRPSNSSSSSGVSSLQSSAASSASNSSVKLPTVNAPHHKVLIKVPPAMARQTLDFASTSFTSSSRTNPVPNKPSSVQVTVVSMNSSEANSGYNNGSTSTGTGPYASDEEVYSGAESLQYNLFTFEWYHGKMARDESERRLRENGQDGAFLVRDCNNTTSQPNALFTLCLFARGGCHYIQVCRRPEANDRLAVGSQKDSEKTFATLQELVQFHMNEAPLVVQPRVSSHDISQHQQQFLCSLKYPIIRRD